MDDSLGRLYDQVIEAKTADPVTSRTAKLMRAGRSKMAKKLAEEAIEVVIEAMNGEGVGGGAGVSARRVFGERAGAGGFVRLSRKGTKDPRENPPPPQGGHARSPP